MIHYCYYHFIIKLIISLACRLLNPRIVEWMVSTQRFIYYKCNHSDRGKMMEIIKTVHDTPESGLG